MSLNQPYHYRYLKIAEQELKEILKWYIDNGGMDVSDRFAIKVESIIEVLEFAPEAGRALEELPEVRSMRIQKYPYRLYYRVNKEALEVIGLSVYHSKRDLEKLLPELKRRIK